MLILNEQMRNPSREAGKKKKKKKKATTTKSNEELNGNSKTKNSSV